MSGLQEAMLQAIRRRKSDEKKVEAILDLLGLDGDDIIVPAEDLAHLMAYTNLAADKLGGDFGIFPDDWDEEDDEGRVESYNRLVKLLPPHYTVEEE